MAKIKSYTGLTQSKILAEILPSESADMSYAFDFDTEMYKISATPYENWIVPKYAQPDEGFGQVIPCWSLAALLDVLPKEYYPVKDHKTDLILGKPKDEWCLLYWDTTGMQHGEETLGDNPVDVCFDMILKLKERNLI